MLSSVAGKERFPEATDSLATALMQKMGGAGYHCRLAPADLAEALHRSIVETRDRGLLANDLYEQYSGYWGFVPPPEVKKPRTLIAVAWPSAATKVRFHLDGGSLEAVVPPTYISSAERVRCLEVVRSVLEPAGRAVDWATLPVKLLAVKAGLAQYGRNNLAYVTGLGSYVRLGALCTDADLGATVPVGKGSMVMSCCPPCRNCHHVCPTGCIPHAGSVIDASRCLTQINENEGDWPDWLDDCSHNSLVGCMRCQEACPANRYYLRKEEVVAVFGADETAIMLENRPADQLPPGLRARLRELDLEEYSTVLGRNLLALAEAVALRGQV